MENTPTPIQDNDRNVTHQYIQMGQPQSQADTSVSDWIITFLIMIVPIVNFVMLFVWAFGSNTHPSRANWAKASLIFALAAIFINVFLFVILGVGIFSIFSNS